MAVLLIRTFSIEIHIMKARVMPMPLIYAFIALVGAVVMPLLIGSEAILPILASAILGATMAPLGMALRCYISADMTRASGSAAWTRRPPPKTPRV
jgi:hypothetical protein